MRVKLCGLLAAFSVLVLVPPSAATASGPALSVPPEVLADSLKCSEFTYRHREPVLLVPGWGMAAETHFGYSYLKALPKDGFDTCTLEMSDRQLTDMQVSAEFVVHAVRRIKAATGRQVDIVGHSLGPVYSRWALKYWPDLQSKVDDLVSISAGNHGFIQADVICVLQICPGTAWQLTSGSQFMAALNGGDESPGDTDVTSIYSATDQLVQPYTVSRVDGAENLLIQDLCPGRFAGHAGTVVDALAYALTMDALVNPGPAQTARLSESICEESFGAEVGPFGYAELLVKGVPELLSWVISETRWVDSEPPLRAYAQG